METTKKPARRKMRGRPAAPTMGYFIFEIQSWKPSYLLSVNHDRNRESPYREYLSVEAQTICVFPKKLAGRTAKVDIAARRDFLEPGIYRTDPAWIPRSLVSVRLPLSGGEVLTSLPFDSFTILVPALIHGLCRYILLWGPPLSRGVSLCQSMEFAQSVDLSEYG